MTITVIGVGLIGGSMALGLKELGIAKKVIGEVSVQKIFQELLNPKIWAISGYLF